MSNECKLRGCCNKTQCYMFGLVVAVASNLKSSCRTETFRCSTHGHRTRNERDEMQLDHIGSGCICIFVCMISINISCTYTNTFDSTLEPPNLQGRGFLGFSLPMWSLPTEFQRTLTGVRCASRRLATHRTPDEWRDVCKPTWDHTQTAKVPQPGELM